MRRVFDEISDDEWDNHQDFKPSRVLKRPKPSPPPPIRSFAYDPTIILDDDDDEDYVLPSSRPPQPPRATRRFVVADDDDFDEDFDEVTVSSSTTRARRAGAPKYNGNGFSNVTKASSGRNGQHVDVSVEELSDSGFDDVIVGPRRRLQSSRVRQMVADEDAISWTTDEDEGDDGGAEEDGEEGWQPENSRGKVEEEDVVGRALFKCSKISAELRRELYGSATSACDRYAETEAESAACRIVTQEDIDEACARKDSDFKPILKPYQLVGVNFLMLLYRKNIGGAILADEMGLGKTVQAVTYLTLLNRLNDDPGPHLIVSPASVLENWERELKRWCPSFSIILFHGSERTAYAKQLSSLGKSGLPAPFNVLLVCYSLFERRSGQQKDDRKALRRWKWSTVIMDEAHVLKDRNSYRWKNLMSVAQNARQRLMLTGTPLQNDLHELWSLLEFMLPDIFATGDIDLKKLLNAEDSDLISRIKSILGPFILRRLKSDVMQQLVPKIQNVRYVNMSSEQSTIYQDSINEYRAASRARLMNSSSSASSRFVGLLPKRQLSNYFVQFRKIANHQLLVRHIYRDEDILRIAKALYPKGVFGFECSIERAIEELKNYNDFSIHRLLVSYGDDGTKGALTDDHVFESGKCQALAELLPSLKNNGHRVLIFSQWTAMLDILEWALEIIGVTYRRLDGSTQVTDRQTIVDTFNSDTSIFACLLSTRAGGQGLNLIGADTVIIHDMDFNPQMDRQAEDRCHRIGQVKPVTVYRLVTKDTVDEKIYEIARRKLVLDARVLESGAEVDDGNDVPEKTMGEILSALLLA